MHGTSCLNSLHIFSACIAHAPFSTRARAALQLSKPAPDAQWLLMQRALWPSQMYPGALGASLGTAALGPA